MNLLDPIDGSSAINRQSVDVKQNFNSLQPASSKAPSMDVSMSKSHTSGFNSGGPSLGLFNPPIGVDPPSGVNSDFFGIKALSKSDIRLDQMVTLGMLKGTGVSGPVKKMLHVPTITLYAIKVSPIQI
jgi:hypothetical protein